MNAATFDPRTVALTRRVETAAMTPALADLRRLLTVLDEALEMSAAERQAWLARLCAHQPELGRRFGTLLAADAAGSGWLERGAASSLGLAAQARCAEQGAGARVGPYRLLREIGRGGMGRVWLATAAERGRHVVPVALKLPLPALHRSALMRRFERERDILAGLEHPHIARLLDAGLSDEGQPYLALQHVRGRPIDVFCREQRLAPTARVRLVLQVLAAVQHAHERGVAHRDIKPSNVLVTRAGKAVLLDFGIARLFDDRGGGAGAAPGDIDLTQEFGRMLSLHHAAPEQVMGEATGPATDLWALGVLLYELISGRRPFPGASGAQIEQAILHDAPVSPTVIAGLRDEGARGGADAVWLGLDHIVLQALQKGVAQRHASVPALCAELSAWLRSARDTSAREAAAATTSA
ncbi:MAG: serine/threonine protein kinase [Rubrivivax sp.]|nr:serine/threonine protein kinase [Rubrivivax sp.]